MGHTDEIEHRARVGGAGRASGSEVLRPSPRLVEVARAYVESLETDARALLRTQEDLNKTIWQAATIANHNRALSRMLSQVVDLYHSGGTFTGDHLSMIDELLKVNDMLTDDTFTCACGHSTFDHDDKGCQYTGCRRICGT